MELGHVVATASGCAGSDVGALRRAARSFLAFLRRELLLAVLIVLLFVLTALGPARVERYTSLVDWPTIAALTGLLILTKGIESSGFLVSFAHRLLPRVHTERTLAIALVVGAALLSTVLTNDVALFIVIPLTVALNRVARVPVMRLVVFEALAVNTGSALTPIGNPQNLFLWRVAGVSFVEFTRTMLPMVTLCTVALLALTTIAFRATPIGIASDREPASWQRRLLVFSLALYVPFIWLADMDHAVIGLAFVAVAYALFFRRVLAQIDWALVSVFVLMFVDLRLVADLDATRSLLPHIDPTRPEHLFLTGVLGSQLLISSRYVCPVIGGYGSHFTSGPCLS